MTVTDLTWRELTRSTVNGIAPPFEPGEWDGPLYLANANVDGQPWAWKIPLTEELTEQVGVEEAIRSYIATDVGP